MKRSWHLTYNVLFGSVVDRLHVLSKVFCLTACSRHPLSLHIFIYANLFIMSNDHTIIIHRPYVYVIVHK